MFSSFFIAPFLLFFSFLFSSFLIHQREEKEFVLWDSSFFSFFLVSTYKGVLPTETKQSKTKQSKAKQSSDEKRSRKQNREKRSDNVYGLPFRIEQLLFLFFNFFQFLIALLYFTLYYKVKQSQVEQSKANPFFDFVFLFFEIKNLNYVRPCFSFALLCFALPLFFTIFL